MTEVLERDPHHTARGVMVEGFFTGAKERGSNGLGGRESPRGKFKFLVNCEEKGGISVNSKYKT